MKPWSFLRDFPTARQTRLGLLVGLPLALIFGQRAVAWADLQLTDWKAGQPLKAADLKDQFQKVKDEFTTVNQSVTALQNGGPVQNRMVITYPNGDKYSIGATFKKVTESTTKGLIQTPDGKIGYRAAKKLCEGTTGSPSAHMCTLEEAVRSSAIGSPIVVPVGLGSLTGYAWVASGGYVFHSTQSLENTDCQGYRNGSSSGYAGNVWYAAGEEGSIIHCGNSQPIACCD